jgi:esterase/lipase superfamily enzyme
MDIRSWALTLLVAVALSGCASKVQSRGAAPPPSQGEFVLVKTFFATDRNHSPSAKPNDAFGSQRDALKYGIAAVSIPRDHRMGEIEQPRLWFGEDPAHHVVLLAANVKSPDAFFQALSAEVLASNGHNALVFVHGYNVTFAEAARRTAQMAYDLGFDGAPVFYSWPSAGSFSGYAADAASIEWSQANIERFLVDFFRRSQADHVYVIAHSMGNRALTRALVNAAREEPTIRTKLKQVVLAAPDIDADVFRNQIAPGLVELHAPVTLYASSGDLALKVAQELYGSYPRAGQSGDDLVLVHGMDTIDASAVDTGFLGHSYYGDEQSILSDMFYMFRGVRPEARAMLMKKSKPAGDYWAFRP